jgi:hypothetical protein
MSNTKNNENLITCCGLYCGDCHGYTGRVADLARDLRKELRQAHYEKFAENMSALPFGSAFKDYQQCYQVLGQMVKFRCRKGCRDGGGPPFCKIRKCVKKKQFNGCWECSDFESCIKLDFLKPVHGNAHIKNLKILKSKRTKEFINGKRYWYVEA